MARVRVTQLTLQGGPCPSLVRMWGPGVRGHGWLRTRRVTVSIEVGDCPFSGRSNQMCGERAPHRPRCTHSTCWPWLPWWSRASRSGAARRTPECPLV